MRLLCEMECEENAAYAQKQLALIERMEHLVQALLKLQKLDANAFAMHFTRENLKVLCLAQADRFAQIYPEKHITVTGENLFARVDAHWIGEAIGNILKNACEHTKKEGSIAVQLLPGDGFAWLHISDDGGGVPQEQLPMLFTRFSSVCTQVGSGTGLGLAIVRSIVEKHHGTVYAQNAQNGLRISIALPLLTEHMADMSAE